MKIFFDELFKYERKEEHSFIAIPFKKGETWGLEDFKIFDENTALKTQSRITAKWDDGSVKWGFFRFMCNLPRFTGKTFTLKKDIVSDSFDGIELDKKDAIRVKTGALEFELGTGNHIFSYMNYGKMHFDKEQLVGPILTDGNDVTYDMNISNWRIEEEGPLVCKFVADGENTANETTVKFQIFVTAFYKKSYIDIGYRIINTTDDDLHIKNLSMDIIFKNGSSKDTFVVPAKGHDSTGCGDKEVPLDNQNGPVFHTMGTTDMKLFTEKLGPISSSRNTVAMSNYRTEFYSRNDGNGVCQYADSNLIIKEANEHFTEVMYGTFFADMTNEDGGICTTIFQAQQNYPKAISTDQNKMTIYIVPDVEDKVVMLSGMSRTQNFMMHFHDADESLTEINNRSLIYQMPDRAHIDPNEYKKANVVVDVFVDKKLPNVEMNLVAKADNHARAYGMLNFGDAPDPGYTSQGRGGGEPVWTNNEYDFPHACALMYMRTGTRRFYDYMSVATSHWMDVDICHYSKDPLRLGGQWEHTNGHCKNGTMVCSHEWVEGLLDYYHLTGDSRAYTCAINIGHNVQALLETPMFRKSGEANARETGWALRTLVALYLETYDPAWLVKCDWIVGHFKEWEEEYGHWLSPYTDNTSIRVPFMISIAIGSLIRYYRVKANDEIKGMILRSVDDMIEHCILDNGLFYYKGIPSLTRNGNNTLVLEALTVAYELTGDASYLTHGIPTFVTNMNNVFANIGNKVKKGDAVISGNAGTKNFAQSFLPLTLFYKAASEEGILNI